MADISLLTILITALRAEIQKNSISPERVGNILQRIVDILPTLVEKIDGKSLSKNDYTDSDKSDLINAVRQLREIPEKYISKIDNDTVNGIISFLSGIITSSIQSSDFIHDKSGYFIGEDGQNNCTVESDVIYARKKLIAKNIQVNQYSHVVCGQIISKASSIIAKVEEYDSYYRCYINTTDVLGREVNNQWVIGDQALCDMSRIYSNLLKAQYYWRLVVGVGADFVDLSKSDCDGSDSPKNLDELILCGNRTDKARQSIYAVEGAGDFYELFIYVNINSFSLKDKDIIEISPSGAKFPKISIGGNINIEDELNKRKKFTLELDNEFASVTCDSSGNPIGDLPTCHYQLFEGTDDVTSLWKFSIVPDGATIEETSDTLKGFKITSLTKSTATITIVASKDGENSIQECMTVTKSMQGASNVDFYLYIVKGSQLYRDNQGFVATIQASVMYMGHEIISSYEPSQLVWSRESENAIGDPDWNLSHQNIGKELTITTDDLVGDTTICLQFLNKDDTVASAKTMSF